MAKGGRRSPPPSTPNPGGSHRCRLCDGLIVEGPSSGLELGHKDDCLANPFREPKH